MAAAPFSSIEARITAAVCARLSNAVATGISIHGQPLQFNVIFDSAYSAALGGMISASGPQVQCKSSDIEALSIDNGLTVNAVAYSIRNHMPDGTGLSLLELEVAAP